MKETPRQPCNNLVTSTWFLFRCRWTGWLLPTATDSARDSLQLRGNGLRDLLADEKHVYGAEIEIVEEWERRKTVVCWVLTSIELQTRVNTVYLSNAVATHRERTMTVLPLY